MARFRAKALTLISVLVLLSTSSFTVLADEFDDIVSFVQLPQALPSHPPAEPPKSHKGGHHHHHHKQHAPTPAPVKPPTLPPSVKPPPPSVKPPTHPPSVKPPPPSVKPPTHPPSVKPPPPSVKPPTHPPSVKPPPPSVKPPTPSPPPATPPSYPVLRKLFAVQGVVYCKSCKYSGIDTLLGASPLVGAVVKLQCNNTKYKPVEATATTDKNGYFFLMPKNVTTAASHKCKAFLVSSPLKTCNVPTNLHSGSTGAILMPAPVTPPGTAAAAAPKPAPVPSPLQIFTVGPFAFEPSKKIPCPR